jgi:ABC-2 type transport system permease protein
MESTASGTADPKSLVVDSEYVYRGVAVDSPYIDQLSASLRDLRKGAQQPQVWALGALRSVANSYKKTILGPWWITISMCFFIFGLSYLRTSLGGSDRFFSDAVAFVGAGFIGFSFISGAVTSAAGSFSSPQGVHATSALPLSTSIFRTVTANMLDFAHEAIVILLIIAVFGIRPSWRWLEVAPGIFLVMLFHFGLLLWLGPLVCRFRDVGPIVSMIQRIAIFLSPIFWSVDQVQASGRIEIAKWNPYTYFISAFRDPLLGLTYGVSVIPNPLVISLIISLANLVVGLLVFGYSFPRLTYWATAV